MTLTKSRIAAGWRCGTAATAIAVAAIATPAFAQDQGASSTSTAAKDQNQGTAAPQVGTNAPAVPVSNVNPGATPSNQEIVITGTMFRRTNTETPSPVTVLSSETLSRRGITTVADAVRSISADNSGSVPTAFSNGFGSGGAAPSLRGLTVNSTLVLMDGQRISIFPLADDGQRNFVDLNTLPRVALDRIEVLKDGASSTYGADAIGGVVNLITRKSFNGLDANIEGGITQKGDGAHWRGSFLAGTGDYDNRGFNIYVGGEYELNKAIYTADRGFPYNTANLSNLPGGQDLNWGTFINGSSSQSPVFVTVPASQSDLTDPRTGSIISGGASVILNPSQCGAFNGSIVPGTNGGQTCEINQYLIKPGLTIQPKTVRYGGVVRASVRVSDNSEAYVMGSFYRSQATVYPLGARTRSTNPINTTSLVLPAYLTNGSIDPYDPFASAGCDATDTTAANYCPAALLRFRFPNIARTATGTSSVWRIAAGINGGFGDAWHYQVDATASASDLHRVSTGNIYYPALANAINNGLYNFADPLATPANVVNDILRTVDTTSQSQLFGVQGTISRALFQLPGGPLQLGVGAQIRHEELDNPNQNPNNDFIDVNQVFAKGQRTVEAGYFEISAPIVKQLEVDVSGRYDHYSAGFSAFSPKAGFKFTPIRQLAFRGTYSRGFRAPSFAESGGGVIGFTTVRPPCIVRITHGATGDADNCSGGDNYVNSQALGYNSAGNPNLKPEKSRNFTLGVVAQPIAPLSFTLDYYNIKKTDVITQGPLANTAIENFYEGLPLPPGYSVQTYPADPDFPNGIPVVSIVNTPYVNAASIQTSGLDFSALFQKRFSPSVRFSSTLEVTKILKFNLTPCGGCAVQHYAGTLGPYQLSSGAGMPDWRGNWSNSLEFGRATVTATANYIGSYWDYSEDTSALPITDKCVAAGDLYDSHFCKTKKFIWVDLVGSFKLNDNVTIYGNVLNLFNAHAPIEPANYAGAAANYNPTWDQAGAIGRAFRLGVNFSFRPRPYVAPVAPVMAPPPPPPPATVTCESGAVITAPGTCPPAPAPQLPPPPPPPAPAPERG
jgi:iron complex outermembrane receptor protein